jgi:hypothetical protein
MPKCDTAETKKELLMDDGVRDGWCRACYKEFIYSDDVHPRGVRCYQCKVIHRRARMYEKFEGWLCFGCAKEYEEKLLKSFAPACAKGTKPDS